MSQQSKPIKYSAVIPVYNSANIVGETIDQTVTFFETQHLDYELVVVNDGSSDESSMLDDAREHGTARN